MVLTITFHEDAEANKNGKRKTYKLFVKDEDFTFKFPRITFSCNYNNTDEKSTYMSLTQVQYLKNQNSNYDKNLKIVTDFNEFLQNVIIEKDDEIQFLRNKLDFYQKNTEYLYD